MEEEEELYCVDVLHKAYVTWNQCDFSFKKKNEVDGTPTLIFFDIIINYKFMTLLSQKMLQNVPNYPHCY